MVSSRINLPSDLVDFLRVIPSLVWDAARMGVGTGKCEAPGLWTGGFALGGCLLVQAWQTLHRSVVPAHRLQLVVALPCQSVAGNESYGGPFARVWSEHEPFILHYLQVMVHCTLGCLIRKETVEQLSAFCVFKLFQQLPY